MLEKEIMNTRRLAAAALPILDLILPPILYPCAWLLKLVRRIGVQKLPRCKRVLLKVGVFPIRKHYYEPKFDYRDSDRIPTTDRHLPGIEWNYEEQLELLSKFSFADELKSIPDRKSQLLEFFFNNGMFEAGDAEYWYQLIRATKPRKIYEIGSGHSTLMAVKAISGNRKEDDSYRCEHVCIEPYEREWLEKTGVSVVRGRVEEVDPGIFDKLGRNDVLFIDSSHMIRPRGDVLCEYMEILPTLKPGVIVHIHDIFTPRDYLRRWVEDEVRFWNEQYLVEAFLTHNNSWKIIGACNYLHHHHFDRFKVVAPYMTREHEPGSLYIQRIA